LGLSTDYGQRGSSIHDVLSALHRKVNDERGGPSSIAGSEPKRLRQLFSDLTRETIGRGGSRLQEARAEIERRIVIQVLANYPDQTAGYEQLVSGLDKAMLPAHFEVSFGSVVEKDADPLSRAEPLVVRHAGREVKIAGRIDRIDVGAAGGQTLIGVVDYKSGQANKADPDEVREGYQLQVTLYALACEELLFADRGALVWHAGYWYVRTAGIKQQHVLSLHMREEDRIVATADWTSLRAGVARRVVELVEGIRSGQFPMLNRDDGCTGYCEWRTVCRVGQARSLEKQWQPPRLDQN
jgi:ATP-dependent helicase/DNAse subunit B